jgi:hypothetical protein
MKPALDQLFLLGILSATIHWLVARSEIAAPLWSRARGIVDKLLRCPACSGFWLGGALTFVGVHPLVGVTDWRDVAAGTLCGVFLTPVFEAVLLWGLERTAIGEAPLPGAESTPDPEPALTESGEITPNERPNFDRND